MLAAWTVGVVAFRLPVGYSALVAAVLLLALRLADEAAALQRLPWGALLMVCGVATLVALVEKAGGLDLMSALIARLSTPATVNGVVAFVTGLISTWSSTSGVVLPAFLPTVPALVERLGGGDPLAVSLSINVGSSLVDVSPLSTLGALCISALADAGTVRDLFRRLMAWGLSMTVVGALLCQLFAGLLARACRESDPMSAPERPARRRPASYSSKHWDVRDSEEPKLLRAVAVRGRARGALTAIQPVPSGPVSSSCTSVRPRRRSAPPPPCGRLGVVVLLREVGEHDGAAGLAQALAEVAATSPFERWPRGPEDPLLERPGVGPVAQHAGVVVRLHEQGVAVAEGLDHAPAQVAEVGRVAEESPPQDTTKASGSAASWGRGRRSR